MFNLKDKIKYYKSRYILPDRNKSGFARGFVNGSSVNHTRWHNMEVKKELSYWYGELKKVKNEADRQDIIESISYCKGELSGYSAKIKDYNRR